MPELKSEPPKKVPPRNDLKSSALYKGSRAEHLQGRDPGFAYEWKTLDDNHPHSLKNSGCLEQHERGSDIGGYVTVDGWQIVQRSVNDKVNQIEVREDQGKPIDTVIRRGKQVLCRLPKSEHAKYAEADNARAAAMQKAIYSPERQGDGQASMTAIVSDDPAANHTQMLLNAGHNIPGMSPGRQ